MFKCNELFFGGIACLLSIGLTACSLIFPPSSTPEDIVGLWVERREASTVGSAVACATIEFFSSGRFEAHNIPEVYFLPPFTSRINASGKWQLDTSSKDPFAWDVIHLEFDPSQEAGYKGGFDTRVYISTDGHERILFIWRGDESNRFTFVKRNKAECK